MLEYIPLVIIGVMRKIKCSLVLLTVVCMLIASACATTRKGALFSDRPIAIVSVVSNYDVNWKGEEPITTTYAVGNAIRRTRKVDEDWVTFTRADNIIDEAEEIIRSSLGKFSNVTLAPKDEILRSRSYNEARLNPVQEKEKMIHPTDYRMVYYGDKNLYPALARETGIEKFLFVTLNLTKEMSSGLGKNGRFRAKVSMSVMLKDIRGKTLFYNTYESASYDEVKVTSGAYSENDLLELLRFTISDVCRVFLKDLKLLVEAN